MSGSMEDFEGDGAWAEPAGMAGPAGAAEGADAGPGAGSGDADGDAGIFGADGVAGPGEDSAEAPVPEDGGVAADPLSEAMETISNLEDELARARADLYNLTQEYNGYVKRSKADGLARYDEGLAKMADVLLPVLDDIQLARDHGDLTGVAGQIAEKLEQTLGTNFKIERFGAEGDAFDPNVHEALMHSTSPEVEAEQVATLIQPGYRMGDKLLRPARVGVVSPE